MPLSPLPHSTQTYTATVNISATAFPLGTLQVTGIYLGDQNTNASSSAAVPLTVTASDFKLTVAGYTGPIKSGQTATFPIALSDPFGVGVPVTLACAHQLDRHHPRRHAAFSNSHTYRKRHADRQRIRADFDCLALDAGSSRITPGSRRN